MPSKRILREFRIDEISGVDSPAQEGARVAILKRAGKSPTAGEYLLKLETEELDRIVGDAVSRIARGDDMTDLIKQTTDDESTIGELRAELARAHAVVALNGDERAHFDGLSEDARTAFLAKSASDRATEINAVAKAAPDNDPVVYTTYDGVEIRKSEGTALIAMAKANDALREEAEALRQEREQQVLEKRAEIDLAHISGDVATRAAMLKAIDAIEDEARRDAAHKALRAQNDAMAKAFQSFGHNGSPDPTSPEVRLDEMAKAHADKESISQPEAYAAVLRTEQGRALYAETLEEAK